MGGGQEGARWEVTGLPIAVVFVGACGGDGTDPTGAQAETAPIHLGTLTQSDSECVLEAVEGPIGAGPATIRIVNDTEEEAEFHLWRVSGGRTYEELEAHIEEERRVAEAGEPAIGAPSDIAGLVDRISVPVGESEQTVGLMAGTHGIVCFRQHEALVEDEHGGWRPDALVGPLEVAE